ncbi:MAG: GDP-mannose 4,6-dehydratase [Planctomycetota bacterium]|nr:GDP-mannose 4,6-dehydratase [Planctomycetota bacterium]
MTAFRRALITGITGQDGSYLADLLLSQGYEVHGIIRRASGFNTARLEHIYQDPHDLNRRLILHYGDITDANVLAKLMRVVAPDEVYNLAAQSHVRVSFDQPIHTAESTALGTLKLLEAVANYRQETSRDVRFVQASSSEMFGRVVETPQRETTPFRPRSPYACAKAFAHYTTVNYRESYGLHASCAIMFNHESPRRGETFVTRKITRAAGRIRLGLQEKLFLGNIDAVRDWGYAADYVRAMALMARQTTPDDYVIATGVSISVRQFLTLVFEHHGLDWNQHVVIDPRYFRPAEVDSLQGDASKARTVLGWSPIVDVAALARMMADADLELARREKTLRDAGHDLPRKSGHEQ